MLRGGLPGARWIDPENYHVTLRFIGDVDDVIAHEVASLLGRVRREPFELRVEDLKSFGGRKPRAIVATLGPAQALMELQAEHERLMQRVGLEPEGRKYTPHVVARAAARIVEPPGGGLSGGARAVPLAAVQGVALRAVLLARVGRRRALRDRSGLSAGGADFPDRSWPCVCVTPSDHTGFSRRDCTSSMAVAKPCPSARISRISDSGVGRGVDNLAHDAARNRSSGRHRICGRAAACACCRPGTPCAGT